MQSGQRYIRTVIVAVPLFSFTTPYVSDVAKTQIASLDLPGGEAFDFGDDWWHQINVMELKDQAPKGKYPKVTKRVGASPRQYPEF